MMTKISEWRSYLHTETDNKNWTIQYAQKQLKTSHKNAINLTIIVHIAQMDSNKIRILLTERGNKNGIYNSRNREINKDN